MDLGDSGKSRSHIADIKEDIPGEEFASSKFPGRGETSLWAEVVYNLSH